MRHGGAFLICLLINQFAPRRPLRFQPRAGERPVLKSIYSGVAQLISRTGANGIVLVFIADNALSRPVPPGLRTIHGNSHRRVAVCGFILMRVSTCWKWPGMLR